MRIQRHLFPGFLAATFCCLTMPLVDDCRAIANGEMTAAEKEPGSSEHPELSLPTDFWRMEFVNSHGPEATQNPANRRAGDNAGHVLQVPKQGLSRHTHISLEQQLVRENTLIDSEPSFATGIDVGETPATLDDWEQTSVLAASSERDGLTTSAPTGGPSVITMLVAVAGVVVLCGAYLKQAQSH